MKVFKEEDFMNDLIAQPWSLIEIYEDPEDALQTFIHMFLKVLGVHAPLREKRVKHKHQPDWFTDSTASAIRERNKAKQSKNIVQYKIWRNKTKKMIFAAKRDYFNQTINQNKRNPKSLWKNLKELSGKNKKYQPNLIHDSDSQPIMDPITTANAFHDFFTNVFNSAPDIKHLEENVRSMLQNHVKATLPTEVSFEIPLFTDSFIKKQLLSLDTTKACRLDGLSPRFLKISANVITNPLVKIFNMSLLHGKFPGLLKIAKVTPIHKKGSKSDKSNYRPISILPILTKIFEKHVSDHLKSYLDSNNLLYTNQSGFRSNHSCETALTATADNWISSINSNNYVGTVFLDLSKAFDLVNHEIL